MRRAEEVESERKSFEEKSTLLGEERESRRREEWVSRFVRRLLRVLKSWGCGDDDDLCELMLVSAGDTEIGYSRKRSMTTGGVRRVQMLWLSKGRYSRQSDDLLLDVLSREVMVHIPLEIIAGT